MTQENDLLDAAPGAIVIGEEARSSADQSSIAQTAVSASRRRSRESAR
jgi:hypothetical protein